jgi:hypothetical protein
MREREITGQGKHTISSSTSYPRRLVYCLLNGEKDKYFYFLYGGHDCVPKRKFDDCAVVPWRRRRDRGTTCFFLNIAITRFPSQVHCPSFILTVFHATGRSRRLTPTHLTSIHSLYLPISTWKSLCVEARLGSEKLFQIIRCVQTPSTRLCI